MRYTDAMQEISERNTERWIIAVEEKKPAEREQGCGYQSIKMKIYRSQALN